MKPYGVCRSRYADHGAGSVRTEFAVRRQRHCYRSQAGRRKDLPPGEFLSACSGAHQSLLQIAFNRSLRRSLRFRLHARYLAGERVRTVP
jgi:hypothetical protein